MKTVVQQLQLFSTTQSLEEMSELGNYGQEIYPRISMRKFYTHTSSSTVIQKRLSVLNIKVIPIMRLSDSSSLVVLAELMINALINQRSMGIRLRFNSLITIKSLKQQVICQAMIAPIITALLYLLLFQSTLNSLPKKHQKKYSQDMEKSEPST